MPRYDVVSRERHAQKKWLRFSGHGFAAADAAAPVVGVELGRAALAMPLAFFVEPSGRYTLVAVLSPIPGRNMFVGPGGRWLGSYIPAWFRAYPFRLLPKQGADEVVLGVDADSGLLVEGNTAGEDFFDNDGNISPALKAAFEFLMKVERSRRVTELAVAALAQAGVIRPWQIKLKTEQGEQAISGLNRIDEAALGALPDDAFLKLRKTLALPIAYAQMLSTGQLGIFEQLAKLHKLVAPPPDKLAAPPPVAGLPETLDNLFGIQSDDVVRFD
jgi:hypothetical protein